MQMTAGYSGWSILFTIHHLISFFSATFEQAEVKK